MESIYVLCVVLTMKSESVCFRVPKEKTCDTIVNEWVTARERWAEKSPGTDKKFLCGCLRYDHFMKLKKPLFTVGDSVRK